MKLISPKRVLHDSDEEFYNRQKPRSNPHDNDRLVTGRNAELLHFLMFGGELAHTEPLVVRDDPAFPANVKFLDVGCRDGWSLDYLKRGCSTGFMKGSKCFTNVLGLELIKETVDYAKSKGRNVVQADIRKPVIEENAYDVIYTRHCLEHLDEPLEALRNMTKMLKSGGTLFAIVPKETNDLDLEKSVHSYLFCEDDDLAKIIEDAGLKVTQNIVRTGYTYKKRKYWYKLRARQRQWGPELAVLATKAR